MTKVAKVKNIESRQTAMTENQETATKENQEI